MATLDVVPDPPGASDPPDPDRPGDVPPVDAPRPAAAGSTRWFDCTEPAVGAVVRLHLLLALNARLIDPDVIADAAVLVSELVTNVRDHTACERVGVRLEVRPGRVVVAVVEDRPSTAPPGDAPDPAGPTDTGAGRRERVRGLQIVDAVAAEWGFVHTDGVVTAWFALATAPNPLDGAGPP